jgi:hypothetical protein
MLLHAARSGVTSDDINPQELEASYKKLADKEAAGERLSKSEQRQMEALGQLTKRYGGSTQQPEVTDEYSDEEAPPPRSGGASDPAMDMEREEHNRGARYSEEEPPEPDPDRPPFEEGRGAYGSTIKKIGETAKAPPRRGIEDVQPRSTPREPDEGAAWAEEGASPEEMERLVRGMGGRRRPPRPEEDLGPEDDPEDTPEEGRDLPYGGVKGSPDPDSGDTTEPYARALRRTRTPEKAEPETDPVTKAAIDPEPAPSANVPETNRPPRPMKPPERGAQDPATTPPPADHRESNFMKPGATGRTSNRAAEAMRKAKGGGYSGPEQGYTVGRTRGAAGATQKPASHSAGGTHSAEFVLSKLRGNPAGRHMSDLMTDFREGYRSAKARGRGEEEPESRRLPNLRLPNKLDTIRRTRGRYSR